MQFTLPAFLLKQCDRWMARKKLPLKNAWGQNLMSITNQPQLATSVENSSFVKQVTELSSNCKIKPATCQWNELKTSFFKKNLYIYVQLTSQKSTCGYVSSLGTNSDISLARTALKMQAFSFSLQVSVCLYVNMKSFYHSRNCALH